MPQGLSLSMHNNKKIWVLLSSLLLTGLTACVTSPANNEKNINNKIDKKVQSAPLANLTYVRTVEGIDEYRLENGLKVLLYPDQAQPKTLVNITYRVGSVNERYGETGMAHLLEHMLFKGSTNFPKIDTEFQKRGMRTNATTWLDRTNYFGVFDANSDTLAWTLGMEADRMVNATFNAEQLKSEMTVVRNEMEKNENNPVRILLSRMFSTAHLWHNYGNSTIGARSDVENFPFEKLRAFYKSHYRPDNAVLTIAGRFDKNEVSKLIAQTFGAIKKPTQKIEALYTTEPTQDGEREINLRRVGDIPVVGLLYHLPSGLHQDAAAMSVLEEILADSTRGRLQKQLVEAKLSTGATAFTFLLKDSSQFILIAQGEKGQNTQALEKALLNITENIAKQTITKEDVEQAKLKLAKQSEQAMRDVTRVGMALSEYIAKGDYRHAFYFRDQIEKVTMEQVQAAAEKYLIRSNRTLGRFIPTTSPIRAELPPAPDLNALLADYKGKAVINAGEVYDNNVENIQKRLKNVTWSEGTQVHIYPKKLRGDEIIIKMNFPTGNLTSLNHQATAFDYIAPLLKLGNKKYSKAEISAKLNTLKSSIDFSSSVGVFNVNIKTDKQHINNTLTLLNELLTQANFDENELETIKRASIADLEAQRSEPGTIALNSFRKKLYDYPQGHPKAFLTIDQKITEINQLTSIKLQQLYQQHFTIEHGHIAVIGEVQAQPFSQQLHKIMSPFTTGLAYQKITTQLKQQQGITVSTETPDKANAQLYVINPLSMNTAHPDYIALSIAMNIFGGDPFTSRLGARIRVKEGYSYSVGAGLQIPEDQKQGLYYASAISAPENINAVIKALQEEMNKVANQGFTQDELNNAVQGFINDRARQWAENSVIANILIDSGKYQRDLNYYNQQIENVKALSLSDVKNAFVKHIASQKINVFKAGDFAKVTTK